MYSNLLKVNSNVYWKSSIKIIFLCFRGLDLSKFRNSIVPVLCIEEDVDIDDENFRLIKEKLIGTEAAVRFAGTSGVIFSLLAGVMVVIYIGHRVSSLVIVLRQRVLNCINRLFARLF